MQAQCSAGGETSVLGRIGSKAGLSWVQACRLHQGYVQARNQCGEERAGGEREAEPKRCAVQCRIKEKQCMGCVGWQSLGLLP
jgi:hypothetical protein